MKAKLAQFWNDEEGITALEYGLIAGLVAVALVVGVGAFTGSLKDMFNALKAAGCRQGHVMAPAGAPGPAAGRRARPLEGGAGIDQESEMKAKLMQFWNDDAGITALEYGLIAGLVAVALIASVGLFTGSLQGMYQALKAKLDAAQGT